MSTKKQIRRALYSEAKKYLDIKSILPKSNIDYRNLTDYQAKRISKELRHLYGVAGGKHYLESTFVKIKRTKAAKEYIVDSMLPKSAKGVLLPGGTKINSEVRVKDGALFYKRGASYQGNFPIDATSEKTIKKSIRANAGYINNSDNVSYIGTAGGKVQGVNVLHKRGKWERVKVGGTDAYYSEEDSVDEIENVAVSLFIKYSAMAAGNERRMNGRIAAHPNKWGMTLIVEKK